MEEEKGQGTKVQQFVMIHDAPFAYNLQSERVAFDSKWEWVFFYLSIYIYI